MLVSRSRPQWHHTFEVVTVASFALTLSTVRSSLRIALSLADVHKVIYDTRYSKKTNVYCNKSDIV